MFTGGNDSVLPRVSDRSQHRLQIPQTHHQILKKLQQRNQVKSGANINTLNQ